MSGTPRTWTLHGSGQDPERGVSWPASFKAAHLARDEEVEVVELEPMLDLIEAQLCDPTSVDARRLRGFAYQHGRAVHGRLRDSREQRDTGRQA